MNIIEFLGKLESIHD